MSKRKAPAWRYLKRPTDPVIVCANGWTFDSEGDVQSRGDTFWSDAHQNWQTTLDYLPIGQGPISVWRERTTRATLMLDHCQDERTGRWLLHAQIGTTRLGREPNWEETKAVRYAVFPPDVDVQIMLPRHDIYVNIAEHCYHLWQSPEVWTTRWNDNQTWPGSHRPRQA
jgi:hypothetical protein